MEEFKCWTAVWILLPAMDQNTVAKVTEGVTKTVNYFMKSGGLTCC